MRDVIVVGGGHNGLVAAAYLAAAGLKVIVLERVCRTAHSELRSGDRHGRGRVR